MPCFTGRIREAFGAFPHFGERLPVPRVIETFAATAADCVGLSAEVFMFMSIWRSVCSRRVICLTMSVRQRKLGGFLPSDLGMFHFFPG